MANKTTGPYVPELGGYVTFSDQGTILVDGEVTFDSMTLRQIRLLYACLGLVAVILMLMLVVSFGSSTYRMSAMNMVLFLGYGLPVLLACCVPKTVRFRKTILILGASFTLWGWVTIVTIVA